MFKSKEDKQPKTVKIAFWYVVSNMFVSALAFISTPIFSRLLTKDEYGQFSNFLAWMGIAQIAITLNIGASISRAKYDYEKDMDDYFSTLVIFNNITTFIIFVLVEIFSEFFEKMLSMDVQYIRILLVYVFFYPAFSYLQLKHRMFQKYKFFSVFAILTAIIRTMLSILCVFVMSNKLYGRILGDTLSMSVFCAILWMFVLYKGRKPKIEYLKYALLISVPMVPHALAGNILTTADRIMITNFCGSEDNAIYSLAYSVSSFAAILWTSMNQAWAPWVYDNMALENRQGIWEKSKLYIGTFSILLIGVLLISPEIVLIMGSKKYFESRFLMPPVIVACAFQFVYGMYVNIEIFIKKTFQISVGTVAAAIVNIVLNYFFIPIYGYQAAAYTTLIGYIFLWLFHFIIVKANKEFVDIYDTKFILKILAVLLLISFLMLIIYHYDTLRYIIITIYMVVLILMLIKYRRQIVSMIK